MRRSLASSLILISFVDCSDQPPAPALLPGDVVRPQIVYAPKAPWSTDTKVALGMLLEVHRPNRDEIAFLPESDVRPSEVVMRARITFLDSGESLGDPLEVPFVKDC